MPGTSAKAWRTRSRGGRVRRAPTGARPRSGVNTRARAVGEQRGRARARRPRARQRARPRAAARAPARRVQAVGHQHEPRRAQRGRCARACSRISAPASWPAISGRGPSTSRAEAAEHLGEPVERVGVARAVLGVAVQRQVGQHDAEAVGERARRPAPTPCARAARSAAAPAAARRRARGRRRARRRGGGRGAAAWPHRRNRRDRPRALTARRATPCRALRCGARARCAGGARSLGCGAARRRQAAGARARRAKLPRARAARTSSRSCSRTRSTAR